VRAAWIVCVLILGSACARWNSVDERTTPEWFRDAAPETGLVFTHDNGATGKLYMPEIMGSGAALLDFDNDGDLDVFFVQSKGSSQFFRNELAPMGVLRFTNITGSSGITYDGYGMGAATGDFDNDGFADLLVTGWKKSELYRNTGKGSFARVNFPHPDVWSSSASFFDYYRDGYLDLVILSYVNFSIATNKPCQAPTGEPDYCTPRAYSPVAARLYHNEKGRFVDVTSLSGINAALGPGLGVAATDLNGDGWPDLFVANDTAANHVWLNQRDGTFKEAGLQAGAAYSEDGLAKAGMGVAAGDYDGDGDDDLLVLNLMREGATLFRNDGASPDGIPRFVDATRASGLYPITLPYTGFGTDWIDFDNDGFLDLFIANGAVTLKEEQRGQPQPYKERNLLIRNTGDGKFIDVTARAGKVFELAEVTRGAAFGDIDNDGDVDIVITHNNGAARLLLNELPKSNWLQVRVSGGQSQGARVTLMRRGQRPLVRRIHTDSSYCSASDARAHFGLGTGGAPIESLVVQWPDGRRERWRDVAPNRTFQAVRGGGELVQ
jgi:hypothetical protein